jgi:hypothetical protein
LKFVDHRNLPGLRTDTASDSASTAPWSVFLSVAAVAVKLRKRPTRPIADEPVAVDAEFQGRLDRTFPTDHDSRARITRTGASLQETS